MSAADGMMLWTGDYLSDTKHLTTVQHGAYLLLLICMWRSGGSLPNDDRLLARYVGLPVDKWRKISPEVRALLTVEGDTVTQERLKLELEKTLSLIEKRRSSGSDGGKAKSRKTKEAKQASASELPKQNATVAPETKTENRKDNSEDKSSGAKAPPEKVSRETLFDDQTVVQTPVYTDSKHELWGEGVPILVSLGVPNKQARSIIGRWMKETRDDSVAVLGAIQRARDNRVLSPIEWITRALQSERENERPGQNRTAAAARSKSVAQDTLLAGMAAALSERPDSRLGNRDAGGWRDGQADSPDDSAEPRAVAAGAGRY